jgi:flagellar biosynthesis/type III secretory pathway protein FliH
MTSKIIKQGSARASRIQRFFFSESPSKTVRIIEQSSEPDLLSVPADTQKQPLLTAASAKSAVDPAQREKEGYEKGFLQGEKAAMEIAEQKLDAVMRRYAGAIMEISNLKASLYMQVERDVVKLAVEVAKKVVHRELQADPGIIQTLVRVALNHVAEKSAVTVHLSPADYSFLLEQRAELSQSEGRDISLLADKSIERGGCFINTECGDIDARIEEKFREVEHAFFEDLR